MKISATPKTRVFTLELTEHEAGILRGVVGNMPGGRLDHPVLYRLWEELVDLDVNPVGYFDGPRYLEAEA
jgi:hypothetical protein